MGFTWTVTIISPDLSVDIAYFCEWEVRKDKENLCWRKLSATNLMLSGNKKEKWTINYSTLLSNHYQMGTILRFPIDLCVMERSLSGFSAGKRAAYGNFPINQPKSIKKRPNFSIVYVASSFQFNRNQFRIIYRIVPASITLVVMNFCVNLLDVLFWGCHIT